MNNSAKTGAAKVWPLVVIAGIVICLAGMAYSFLKLQREAGEESQYRQVADGMRLLSRQIAETSRTTVTGEETVFATLATQIEQFDELIWFDRSEAVTPIPTVQGAGMAETYPFGL